jgi:hypothetical protein
MSRVADEISARLRSLADPGRALEMAPFFKTGPGQYGEGDRFLGLSVPVVRSVARDFRDAPPARLLPLLRSPWHEERLCCLVIWVARFDRARAPEARRELFDLYWKNRGRVNNWDLVDVSAPRLVGEFLRTTDGAAPLMELVRSSSLWDRRIAILATWAWTKAGDVSLTLRLAGMLLEDGHDLMHKATGWMLREALKVDEKPVLAFLRTHAAVMPRTMLRYAIERLDEPLRRELMTRPESGKPPVSSPPRRRGGNRAAGI